MKVDNSLISIAEAQSRRQPLLSDSLPAVQRNADKRVSEMGSTERKANKSASFNLQLNQQLSSMQTAEDYLGLVTERLSQLKLKLGLHLSKPQNADVPVHEAAEQVNQLLEERADRSGRILDTSFNLRLHEPVRSHFTFESLELADIQRSGKENLLFNGRAFSEPVAVVLDDGMSDEQVLRRFNSSLGKIGIRAELDENGALKFSAPEPIWQTMKGQLKVQGEGKLFPKNAALLTSREDGIKPFKTDLEGEGPRELRQILDRVVRTLDSLSAVREQIRSRQQDIREFLARQESGDERAWANRYAVSVFNLMGKNPASYSAVTQTIVAQSNITRYAVVSLLS